MALKKKVIQDDGVTTEYHRILYVQSTVKDTGAAVSTVSKQGSSAAIITATVIVTSTSCAASGITTTSAITSTIGSR